MRPAASAGQSLRRTCAVILVAVALLGAACGGPVDNVGPVQTVQAFIAALEARDASAIIALIEPTEWRREIGPELRMYLGYLDTIAIPDAAYTVERNQGDTSVVRVTGTLNYTLAESGFSDERPFDLQINLVRVDGAWYLRSLQLPQPGV
jgi:hypothetical protein